MIPGAAGGAKASGSICTAPSWEANHSIPSGVWAAASPM